MTKRLVLAGKPDLLWVDAQGHVTVCDLKTGQERASDVTQVQLYMLCLPYTSPVCKGKTVDGCLIYTNGARAKVIEADWVDDDFKRTARRLVDLLDSDTPPARSPSLSECRWCEITAADCPDRVSPDNDDDLPEMDWDEPAI
jgi:hypothetical protein